MAFSYPPLPPRNTGCVRTPKAGNIATCFTITSKWLYHKNGQFMTNFPYSDVCFLNIIL